eukprot:16445648-Heterocapsa_arctica.AAC.1
MLAVAELLGLAQLMGLAEAQTTFIDYEAMTEPTRQRARFLYSMFIQVLSGRAMSVLRLVPRYNGFEAWRQLVREYEPDSPLRLAAMLRSLMAPKFGDNFRAQWMTWERQVAEYDR